MTADYAKPLKVIWEKVHCPVDTCGAFCSKFAGKYCRGHAALLEMVDDMHIQNCQCPKPIPRGCVGLPEPFLPDVLCVDKRRRLRAAVGVDK